MDISLFSRLPDTPQKLLQLTVYVQLKPKKKKKFFFERAFASQQDQRFILKSCVHPNLQSLIEPVFVSQQNPDTASLISFAVSSVFFQILLFCV